MEQSPSSEANSHSTSQEIPCLLWNSKVHYRVQKRPPVNTILSQMSPDHNLTHYSFMIHFNIILPSKPRSPKLCLTFRFPDLSVKCDSHSPHAYYMPRPSHFLDFIKQAISTWKLNIISDKKICKISNELWKNPQLNIQILIDLICKCNWIY